MPYIQIRTDRAVTPEQKKALTEAAGQHVRALGKTENWLMTETVSDAALFFKGAPCEGAMITVQLYGRAADDACDSFAQGFTDAVSRILGVAADRVYIAFYPTDRWAWSGALF